MNVFELNRDVPRWSSAKEFATLDCKRTDAKIFGTILTDNMGKRFTKWRRLEFRYYKPNEPKPDFLGFGLDLVCNQRARDLVGGILEQSGQLLPINVKGERGTYYLYNCTTNIDALDQKRSYYEYFKGHLHPLHLDVPAFRPERLRKATVFHESRSGRSSTYFVAERTGDYRDGEFKAAVEFYRLTGLRFDLLWSEKHGPVPPRRLWEADDPVENRTYDNKPLAFKKATHVNAQRRLASC